MNVEIGTVTPIFLFWEYLFQIFFIEGGLRTYKPYPQQLGDKIDFCIKRHRTLNSKKILKLKSKNYKHIAVDDQAIWPISNGTGTTLRPN
jgi:hypothetical protein